ncbi:MAG TPA: FkbM family methyltransferase [Candidatus Competibacter sp.]|nr:FkbM family methyltransferase [Candidatus Competibacteraceae bacterium]HRW67240.1 FkbM family methyltransferase [Candidatus Competibacter sp.]
MWLFNTIKFIINHPLNQENKLGAIIRFARWQLGSRLVQGAIVYDWINGSRFLVKNGETGLTGNIYTGLHEFQDMAFLLHFLRSEDLFVDVGANVGSYTILACSAIGARGIAFEPVPSTYRRLVENMHLNHLDEKVKCINKGVGAQQGSVVFTSDSDTTNHVLAPSEQCENREIVEVTSLDTALYDESPTLIKIDVEGYETPVLEGAQEALKDKMLHSIIMEINGSGSRYGFNESRLLELMHDYDFRAYSYRPLDRILIDLKGKNLSAGNTLFIRDKSFVMERLRGSPKIFVHGRRF